MTMTNPFRATVVTTPFNRTKQWLMRGIDNLSIRSKLFGYALLLIILMFSLASFVLYQVNAIRNHHIPARAAARDMEATLLTMRTHELNFTNEADSLNTEFYLKHKSVNVDAWQENYRRFEKSHGKLTEIFQATDAGKELEAVRPLMVAYRDTFLALNGAYRERGFQSFGREGVLRQRADALQASLTGDPALLALFLKTQEAQDRFLLYHETSAVSAFHNGAIALQARLTKTGDRTMFVEYVRLFDEVVSIYQKIGLSSTQGLRGELNQLTRSITPHIQATEATVLSSTSTSINSIAESIYIITALLSATAILMSFLIARLIIDKVKLLSEASKQIAEGNLEYRLPLYATDELGQLAVSFNAMAGQLQQGRRKLREHSHALSQSVKRFELVSRAVNEAVYEWDVGSGKLTWGEGIVSVFGYRLPDRTTTIDWWVERIHPQDADSINESLSDRIRHHADNWKKEYRFKRANGEYVYCQDRGFIEYHNGEAVRMVGSIVDISRQKALDRAKDEFISVASHQLRTPLGSIRWNLELLLEEKRSLSKDVTSYAQEAYNSTLRMTGLVGDLLSVARIEQDRVQNIPEKTDLVAITKAALVEMRPMAARRNIRMGSSGLKDKRTSLIIDPKRYREVIQNLLSNAVKYTPPNGKVSVAIERRSKDFVVSVTDTGIGIPLEEQSKLFGKFYRATNVMVTDTEGTGLGLFVVRSYVESWGGKVWFNSKVNQGTTFFVSIPHKPRLPRQVS